MIDHRITITWVLHKVLAKIGDIVKNKRCVNLIVSNFFHELKNVNLTFSLHNISYISSFIKMWRSHG